MNQGRKRDRDDDRDSSRKLSRRAEEGPVSTLHVSGLPDDVRDRELRLLASFLPGLEGTVLRPGGRSTIGFIKFTSQAFALAGAHALHGFCFDEEHPEVTLRVSLAKRDMNVRGGGSAPSAAAAATPYGAFPYAAGAYNPYAMYGGEQAAYAAQPSYGDMSMGGGRTEPERPPPGERMNYTVNTREREQVCDTLCVRGLSSWSTQADLEPLFGRLTGYREMKVFDNKGLAFVRFSSQGEATSALSECDGSVLSLPGSTGRETVLLDYARRSLE